MVRVRMTEHEIEVYLWDTILGDDYTIRSCFYATGDGFECWYSTVTQHRQPGEPRNSPQILPANWVWTAGL